MHYLLSLERGEWERCHFSLGEITSCFVATLPYVLEKAMVKRGWKVVKSPQSLELSEPWEKGLSVWHGVGQLYPWSQGGLGEGGPVPMNLPSGSRFLLSCLFLKGVPSLLLYSRGRYQIPEGNKQQLEPGQKWEERVCSNWPVNDLHWAWPCERALCPAPVYKRQTWEPLGRGSLGPENPLERMRGALTQHPGQRRESLHRHTQLPSGKPHHHRSWQCGFFLRSFSSQALQRWPSFSERNSTVFPGSTLLMIRSNGI